MGKVGKWRYIAIIAISVVFFVMPLFIMLIWSFARSWPWPDLLPQSWGLRGWSYFLNPLSKSIPTLLFSIFLSIIVSFATLFVTIPAAKSLALYKFKGKRLIEVLVFAPIIIPMAAVAMGVHMQFIQWGLANTFVGVVLIQLIPCIPYSLRILTNVFEILGEDFEMQAKVLGANPYQVFRFVTLPRILPGIISAGGMTFIISFSQYFLTFLIGGGQVMTFSMQMFPYIQSGDRMMGSVYSVVFIGTTFVFLMLVEKTMNRFYKGKLKEYTYV